MAGLKVAVAGIGYVGVSNAVLLAQNNSVVCIDVDHERVAQINERQSPIVDADLEHYLAEKPLDLRATTDPQTAYKDADFVIVATPTNYDPKTNFFDTSTVEQVIDTVRDTNPNTTIVIKSTIPVGYTADLCARLNTDQIIFSPEFLREGHALHDNLYPSRIVVGERSDRAKIFAELLQQGALAYLLMPRRRRRSSFSLIPISQCAWHILMSLTAMRWHMTWTAAKLSKVSVWTHVLVTITIIPPSVMGDIACPKIANSFWRTTQMCRKTSFEQWWRPMLHARISLPIKY
jgi:hypothetical protein